MDPVLHGQGGEGLEGFPGRGAVGRADTEVDDGLFPARDPLGIECGDFAVLDGKVVLADRFSLRRGCRGLRSGDARPSGPGGSAHSR